MKNSPQPSQTTVQLAGGPLESERFENGQLEITGVGTFPVLRAYNRAIVMNATRPFVVIDGVPAASLNGKAVKLFDDDDRFASELQLPSLPMDNLSLEIVTGKNLVFAGNSLNGVASVFVPAYILVVDANLMGLNDNRTIPFYLNKDVFDIGFSGVFDDAKDVFDSSVFWAHTVTIGYQPAFSEDSDPNDEAPLVGVTPESPITWNPHGYSAVYTETIRDHANEDLDPSMYVPLNYDNLERDYYRWLFGTIAHETGHAPGRNWEGTDHAEGELMRKGGDVITSVFAPESILRFRRSSSWTGGYP